ncbi:MAG: phage tail tape measure protein, partial [Proteobacteria bacterium]|nr:phage tail tape measure protein [Pseudomonadota bacterium]
MAERIRFELTAADKTKTAFSGVKRGLDRMKRSVLSVKGAFVGLLSVAAAGAVFRKLMGAALPFNRAIAETSTLIEGNKQQLDFLRDTARKMASEFGGSGATQVKAFYQAISAGAGTVEQAAALIQTANKLAIGGVGNLTTSVDVLTTALNNYGKAGLTAKDAADILFTGVKFGKTTIGELGAAIGRTASLAADAGVSFTELVSATAALTTTGISTREAITGVRAILAGIIKPTDQARKMAKKLGIEFNAAGLKAKGFSTFLADLIKATGGSVEQLAQLFGGVEALAPVISLTGAVAEKFSETLVGMTKRAGAMEEAYLKVANALEQRLVVQMGRFGVAAEIAGSAILSVLVPALELVTSNLK